MSDEAIRIELPKAKIIRPYLPVVAFVAGAILIFWGRRNVIARLGGAAAVGIGLKAFFDMRAKRNKGNEIYHEAIGLMEKGKEKEGLEKLEEGLKVDSRNPYLNYGLVMINYQNRNFNNVLKHIENINMDRIKKEKNIIFDEDMYMTLKGVSLYENKDYEKVIDFLEEERDTQNLYKLLSALSFRELGDIEKSKEILSSGVSVENEEDELAFDYWLGVNLFDLGEKEEAREVFKRVYEKDKNYIDVRKYLNKLK